MGKANPDPKKRSIPIGRVNGAQLTLQYPERVAARVGLSCDSRHRAIGPISRGELMGRAAFLLRVQRQHTTNYG